jgi:photosystem II stability/assembly factor-like uncharacterized protein
MRLPVLTAILLFFSTASSSGIHWHQIPTGHNDDFNGLFFTTEDYGYIVTKGGSVLTLRNSKGGWSISRTVLGAALEDIYFLENGRTGFAFGANGVIMRTDNQGRNWKADSLDYNIRFYDMAFLNMTDGLIVGTNFSKRVGDKSVIYATSNGGLWWKKLDVPGRRFKTINISPEGTILVTGRQQTARSTDSGISWEISDNPRKSSPNASAVHGGRGIMVGMGGFLALSNDDGKSWQELEVISEKINLFALLMIDSRRAYAVGSAGEILYTEDSGRNWISQASGVADDLHDIQISGNKIFACGKNGALVYADLKSGK